MAPAPLTYSRTWLLQSPSDGPFPSVAKAPYCLLKKQDKTNKDLHFWEDGVDILFPISPIEYNGSLDITSRANVYFTEDSEKWRKESR